MAWQLTDQEAIEQAIASGYLTVRYADKTIEYRNMKDLLMARDAILSYLNSQSNTPTVRQFRVRPGGTF